MYRVNTKASSILYIKKKGFTLIELIIVITIIGIIVACSVKSVKSYRWYNNNINVDYCNNSIMMFINRAKQYCRMTKSSASIRLDLVNSKISLYDNSNQIIDCFIFPDSFKITGVTLAPGKYAIHIDSYGITGDACKIIYKDTNGEEHIVSICVGTAYVDVVK